MNLLIAWIVSFMVAVAAPGRPTYIAEAVETKEEAVARYESIAADVATVVWDSAEKPIFNGPYGRARTASLIVSIMLHESAFRKDVDSGVGKYARGDGGKSWCLMQRNIGTGRTIPWNQAKYRFARPGDAPDEVFEGYLGTELVGDRKNCIREGLHLLHGVRCGALPVREWLRAYASGSCDKGSKESQARMDTAMFWYSSHRPSFTDADVLLPVAQDNAPNANLIMGESLRLVIVDALAPTTFMLPVPTLELKPKGSSL